MPNSVKSMVSDKIEDKFGKLPPTTVNKHTFIGMAIGFIGGKKAALNTPYYVGEALEDFRKTLKGDVVNPATSKRFTITDEAKYINDNRTELYHSITANILWIMKLSQPYLDTVIYLFCTRFQCPTK